MIKASALHNFPASEPLGGSLAGGLTVEERTKIHRPKYTLEEERGRAVCWKNPVDSKSLTTKLHTKLRKQAPTKQRPDRALSVIKEYNEIHQLLLDKNI